MINIFFIKNNWFLFSLVFVILFAKLSPGVGSRGGVLRPEFTVKYVAVCVIFFNSGLSLRSEALAHAAFQLKTHFFIQLFTFVVFPVVVQILVPFLQSLFRTAEIIDGLKILSCMPPPVSSAVILTNAVSGNEAAAVFNSAFGSFLGIIATPGLILLIIGSEATVPFSSIFLQLFSTVVLPLFFGQLVRYYFKKWLKDNRIPFSTIGSLVLLLIIFTTFCDTFQHTKIALDADELLIAITFVSCLQLAFLVCIFYTSTRQALGYKPEDTISLMFCSTHKSLTLGIPIIKILFGDDDKLSMISIPLLMYHPIQILIGSILVPFLQKWTFQKELWRQHFNANVSVGITFPYPSQPRLWLKDKFQAQQLKMV